MIKALQISYGENFEKMLSYASESGYTDVSVGFGSSRELFLKDNYEQEIENIAFLLKKYNLRCPQTHLVCYELLERVENRNEDTETAIKRSILMSARLGAKWGALHPKTDITNGFDRKKSYDVNKKDIEGYLEYAYNGGVGLAIENMPLYPFDRPNWRFFGGGYEELIELCDSFGSDKIGICWDFGHAHTASIEQEYALKSIGGRLKITHIHDNYRNGDHHLLPLEGNSAWGSIKWEDVMPTLGEISYNGPLTLELVFPPEETQKSYIQHSCDILCQLEKLI